MLRIAFSDAGEKIKEIFQKILGQDCLRAMSDDLLKIAHKLFNYEEEENKINPILLFSIDIENSLKEEVATNYFCLFSRAIDNLNMLPLLKTLIPLCENNWTICINYCTDKRVVQFGIIKIFGDITSVEFFDDTTRQDEIINSDIKAVLLYKSSAHELVLRTNSEQDRCTIIDLRFFKNDLAEMNNELDELCQDMLVGLDESLKFNDIDLNNREEQLSLLDRDDPLYEEKSRSLQMQIDLYLSSKKESELQLEKEITENKKRAAKALKKFFVSLRGKIHGTIVAVVNSNVEVSEIEMFAFDGKILEQPIEIAALAMDIIKKNNQVDIATLEKYYSLTGLLAMFMNVDGITIIDTVGRIRAYNVFVQADAEIQTAGGARTRAFQTIIRKGDSRVKGCYFQSQDGNSQYWRNENYAK